MTNDANGLVAGDVTSGYRLEKVFPFPEIEARVQEFRHIQTGARHLHVETSDRENCFAVAFKTIPQDSTGVAHILEHTILCGSEKYPVRDPFFSMIKRSLSSFMNALTASDWTMYPFATPNTRDFYNLLDVYLDAVFFPILSELSFKQEGHRLGIVPVEGEGGEDFQLVYQGV
ncbi:MAG: insulinase family protein, partial [Desulfosudaceae bacterium]